MIAPSAISVPVKGDQLETQYAATKADIDKLKDHSIKAAKLSVKAGFDVIEIHAAHGHGIKQLLSPITDKRTDKYGGSLYNRARVLFEIITKILLRMENCL